MCYHIPEYVVHGKEVCLEGLWAPPTEPIPANRLPHVLHVQLDNCWKDNKCRFVKAFWSLLTAKGIFAEVHVPYLLVGHTHDGIDASFGRWSMDLCKHDYSTMTILMKSYMEMEKIHVISYMIEELPHWRAFVSKHIRNGKDQQFKFYVRDDGWSVMQYKVLSTHEEWLPKEGILMWKSNIKGEPCIPSGNLCTTLRYDQTGRGNCGIARIHWLLAVNMWPRHNWSIHGFSHAYFPILNRGKGGITSTSHKCIYYRIATGQGILAT